MVYVGVVAQKQGSPKASTLSDALDAKAAILEQQTQMLNLKVRTFLRVVVKQSRRLSGNAELIRLTEKTGNRRIYNVGEDRYPFTTREAADLAEQIGLAISKYRKGALEVAGEIYEEEMFGNIKEVSLELGTRLKDAEKTGNGVALANQIIELADSNPRNFNSRVLAIQKLNGERVEIMAGRFEKATITCLESQEYAEVIDIARLRRSDIEYEASMVEGGFRYVERAQEVQAVSPAASLLGQISLQPSC